MAVKRKLIEVSLPLEAINRESAREKSIRHGHPSTLHLWWARRPLAAARAVLFAQLVDDPSSDDTLTEEKQRIERDRLHRMIEQLVVWENTCDEKLLEAAHQEILKSTNGNPPPILDPFAGGGTIPLEAQRLGLEAHASDLNPVAVLINKALIEIPPKFKDQPPVFPGLADTRNSWKGAEGLAADVRAYGDWMRDQAQQRIGHLYPKATLPDGTTANVIAWIWARTVTCPNPACRAETPLTRSWWLGKKKGKEAHIAPNVVHSQSGTHITFAVVDGPPVNPAVADAGTVGRTGATCVACSTGIPLQYIKEQGRERALGTVLMAVAAEGSRRRIYLSPTADQVSAAAVPIPAHSVEGTLGYYPRDLKAPTYGLTHFVDLFTARQLQALTTLSDLVVEARERLLSDTAHHSLARSRPAEEYADAIATYLAMALSRTLNKSTSINTWDSSPKMEAVRGLFARQAIPMAWDFAEANLAGGSSGDYGNDLNWVASVLERHYVTATATSTARQADAAQVLTSGVLVSTDPPYYDNIGYSDLSDFFYVWLRRSLRDVHPELLSTMLVPKAEELVANPYRHDGKDGAKRFFEDGFRQVFANAREQALRDFPITVYYAFKQSESDLTGTASSGWETLLEGMIRSGWQITATWPMRSELSNRMIASGTNALASSIVLSLRPRPEDAPMVDRRGFIKALQAELPDALRKLQQGAVAPVDLPQAAIGPGMAVFSRYSGVIEPDGSKMTVRSALARINEILDEVLNEQEGDLDPTSRFAIAWFKQHGYQSGSYGDADSLARARNTSVDVMDRDEILTSRAGKVQLLRPSDLPASYDVATDSHTSNWEAAHHIIRVLESEGINQAGVFLRQAKARADAAVDPDQVKELGHLLYRVCEAQGWTKEAISFNTLVTSWPDIVAASRDHSLQTGHAQGAFDFTDEEN
ncbi:DUF1156 domain-containing protein [Luteococcus sp. H138]|uniref:DUF1156 domain-containing protein n=1 Tax=unclassified Luteococcus TaxID=2639923 RepID=UPI00313EC818